MNLKHVLGVAAATVTVASGVIVATPNVVLAHHPVLSKTVTRPCGADAPWSGTVTAVSDADYNKNWQNKIKIGSGSYSAYSQYTDDQVPYGPIAVGPFAAGVGSVTVSVTSHWKNKYDTGGQVTEERSITLYRPPATECPLTPTSGTWTPTNGTCANPQGTLSVTSNQGALYTGSPTGPYGPGESVTGSFSAEGGYVFQGDDGPFSHTFSVAGAPCQIPNNPGAELNAVCAKWNAKFTNAVDGIDPWETVADAEFDLVVDGATEHIVVPANATETRGDSFPEDSGDHTVTVGQQSVTVNTDCEPNQILPPVLTASYDCASQTSSYTLDPSENDNWTAGEVVLEGNTYSVVITPKEGFTFGEGANEDGTLTLTATFVVATNCVIPPPALAASYDCVSQKSTPTLTPPASQQWTAGPITQAGDTYSVTISPNQGLRFANPGEGGTITLTATFTVTSGCEQTVAAPQVTPPTCSAPGAVMLPPSDRYTWRTNDDGTYTAVANEGVRLVGTTTFGPFDLAQLTGDECVIPTIDLAAFSPVCQADTPYIQYEVKVSGTTANDATLTFFDLDGKQVAQYVDVPLSGRVIYPGASVDPPDWPGWKLNSAGLWEIDPTDSRLRDGLNVRVEVNPTAAAKVNYPPATEACSDPDQVESQAPTTTVQLVQLPSTGSGSGRIAGVGGLLLLAGGAMVFLVHRPRHA